MATDSKELERVRFIHRKLDLLAKSKPDDGVTCFIKVATGDGFVTHEYTAAEVRAWPETKAKLRARLSGEDGLLISGRQNVAVVARPMFVDGILAQPDAVDFGDLEKANVARGFCLYREQLTDALSPGLALTADGSVRVNEEQAEALGIRGIDPASDAEPEFKVECHRFNDAHARKLTDALPANVAARARNISALAAELSKPVTPRYPAEGRSERALSVTNGMIRGRE